MSYDDMKSHDEGENDIAQLTDSEGEPHIFVPWQFRYRCNWWNGESQVVVSFAPANEDWKKCLKSVV